jgi:DNA-binding NarL/FixJ family response regulator
MDRMHEIAPQTKIIILSADARMDTIRRALQKGALAYLLKPIEPDAFLGVISDLLHGRPVRKTESVFPKV